MPFVRHRLIAVLVTFLLGAGACANESDTQPAAPAPAAAPTSSSTVASSDPPVDGSALVTVWPADATPFRANDPARLTVEVVRLLNHDSNAFTQGLELIGGGLYESTGLYGESTLRRVDIDSGEVLFSTPLDPSLFGEGITRVGDTLIQLTWREETALRWRLSDLTPLEPFTYQGEGWGICTLDDAVVTSDGSNVLKHRDPEDFSVIASIPVLLDGEEVSELNELECVDGLVLANVFGSDFIVVIEPTTGGIVATIDASPLNAVVDRPAESTAVLNGIADLGDGSLLLGGKRWPHHVVVRLVAA